jgi:catechol 2,3-dioxygenase-like lactoylglutathione lyase family enzyme
MKNLQPEVNLIKIPITDFARGRAFYRNMLGLEEEFAVDDYGWAQYRAGALPLCLYAVGKGGGDGKPGNELNFHLAVSDLAAAFKLLESRGATFYAH